MEGRVVGLVDRSRQIQGIFWHKSPYVGALNNIKSCGTYVGGLPLPLKLQGGAGNGPKTLHPGGADATLLQLLELRKGATTELFLLPRNY